MPSVPETVPNPKEKSLAWRRQRWHCTQSTSSWLKASPLELITHQDFVSMGAEKGSPKKGSEEKGETISELDHGTLKKKQLLSIEQIEQHIKRLGRSQTCTQIEIIWRAQDPVSFPSQHQSKHDKPPKSSLNSTRGEVPVKPKKTLQILCALFWYHSVQS